MPFRIICANDSEIVRQGIRSVCSVHGLEIDEFVGDYAELQRALSRDHFDVLICECRLQKVDMLERLVEIRKELRDLKIIMYTNIEINVVYILNNLWNCSVFKSVHHW